MRTFIILLALLFMPLVAQAQQDVALYEVHATLKFENLNTAIAVMNLFETHKDKVYTDITKDRVSSAKMIKSFDSDIGNYPEFTLITIDFAEASQVYDPADYDTITQADIDKAQAFVNAKQAKLNERQAAIDAAQNEINNP